MTLFWLFLLPVIFNSLFKYLFTLVIPILRFSLVYLFYIPVLSVVFLSSIHYMFFTVWHKLSSWVLWRLTKILNIQKTLLLSLSSVHRLYFDWIYSFFNLLFTFERLLHQLSPLLKWRSSQVSWRIIHFCVNWCAFGRKFAFIVKWPGSHCVCHLFHSFELNYSSHSQV